GRFRRQSHGSSPFGSDDIDIGVAPGARVEGDTLAVRRPARASGGRSVEVCQLVCVGAFLIANPDLQRTRAARIEYDPFAVRRILRAQLVTGRGNQPAWNVVSLGSSQRVAPDVCVGDGPRICQAVSLARN